MVTETAGPHRERLVMASSGEKIHSLSTASSYQSVRSALDEVMAAIAPVVQEAEGATVELCLAEALNNIVEHAYEEKPGGLIEISVYKENASLHFEINDYGRKRPELSVQRFDDPDYEVELKEGGFGLALVETIASRVEYTHQNGRNTTSLWKEL